MIETQSSVHDTTAQEDELRRLLEEPRAAIDSAPQALVGVVVAFADPATPMVVCGTTDGPALQARTTIDLFPEHIGSEVLVTFERGDAARPIVIGRLRKA